MPVSARGRWLRKVSVGHFTCGLSFAIYGCWEITIRSWFEKIIKVGVVVKVKKSTDEIPERNQAAEPMLIELSPTAKTNLKKLQLLSLDRQGRQPDPSQIIEKLINAAALSGPDAPYPR